MYSANDYLVHLQQSRSLYVRVEILNSRDTVINSLEGVAIDGSVNISADSLIRRTANIKFILRDDLKPKEDSNLWMINRIRLWVGLENYNNEISWYNLGVFIINDPSIDISVSERTIEINLLDKMHLLEQTPLGLITKLDAGTNISTAMRSVVNSLGGESRVIIEPHPYNIPYDLEFNEEQSVLDVLEELKNLYMNYEFFYNVDGFFVFQKTRNKVSDPIIWNFIDNQDLRLSTSVEISYSNVKNKIKVIGKMNNVGSTPIHTSEITNADSPFTISKIGERLKVIKDEKYFTVEQCKQLADYELFRASNMAERVNANTVPIYFLDVNQNVYFNSPDANLVGTYCITDLSIPLNFSGDMSFSAYKVY